MLGLVSVIVAIVGIVVAIGIPLYIEAKKRPVLRIEGSEDLNVRDRDPVPEFRIAHIKVIDEPLGGRLGRWLLRNTATSCKVSIAFRSRSDNTTLTIPGRWSGAPEPFSLAPVDGHLVGFYDPTKVPQTLRFDLSPAQEGEVLGIALKQKGDHEAYAFTSESYAADDTRRRPDYALRDGTYDVLVTARAGGIEATASFVLHNQGTEISGLRLEHV
jgi:hypothetical protein